MIDDTAPTPKKNTDMGAIADQHVSEAPGVTPGVPERDAAEQKDRARWLETLKDRKGARFDPALHVTDAKGDPVLTDAGNLKRRPGRRAAPSGDLGKESNTPTKSVPPSGSDVNDSSADFRPTARVITDTELTLASILLGPDWAPREVDGGDERQPLIDAWEAYLREKGVVDIPPGMMLLMVHAAYLATPVANKPAESAAQTSDPDGMVPRMLSPTTRARVAALTRGMKVGQWFRGLWGRLRGARSNRRNAEQREDESRQDSRV